MIPVGWRRRKELRPVGATELIVEVVNPRDPRRSAGIEMLVDSGATYSVVPTTVLRRLGIRPYRSETFSLADGSEVKRALGSAEFQVAGRRGASTVIFGKRGDACLLGVVTLEALGLMLDPLRRRLRPLRLRLGALSVAAGMHLTARPAVALESRRAGTPRP